MYQAAKALNRGDDELPESHAQLLPVGVFASTSPNRSHHATPLSKIFHSLCSSRDLQIAGLKFSVGISGNANPDRAVIASFYCLPRLPGPPYFTTLHWG
jgi:hypothetical protein